MKLLHGTTNGHLSLDAIRPTALSRQLRRATGGFLKKRRGIVGLSLAAAASMGLITLYQTGIIRHLPDPPLPGFDSDKVDASAEAYAWLSAPDGTLGLASYAATAVLAATGGKYRYHRRPWLPIAVLIKSGADALQAARLTRSQWTNHRAFCIWCLLAAGATFGSLLLAVPEAREAVRVLRDHA